MKQFIIKIISITVVLTFIGWLVFSQIIPQYYLPVFPVLLMFFAITSVFVHSYQIQLAKKDMGKFTRSTMLVTFFKLLLYTTFAIVYIAFDTENAKVFVICFLLLYLVFTTFEVISLVNFTSKNKSK